LQNNAAKFCFAILKAQRDFFNKMGAAPKEAAPRKRQIKQDVRQYQYFTSNY